MTRDDTPVLICQVLSTPRTSLRPRESSSPPASEEIEHPRWAVVGVIDCSGGAPATEQSKTPPLVMPARSAPS